ncbi:MAG: beta strand repeat-containing protein, partial [Rhodoluna sp.]
MSLLNTRIRGLVAVLAALAMILVPLNVSSSSAAISDDTSLSVFTVNGTTVQDGDTQTLPPNTTSVDVVALATDPGASVVVAGATGLVAGDNPLSVTVTSSDTTATKTYSVTLSVPTLSSDTSLKSFKVNGTEVVDGEDIYLPYLTQSVNVSVETFDANSTYVILGGTDLVTGDNVLSIVVTAADGSVGTTSVDLIVAYNSDASLITFQVDGSDVQDGSVVELAALTTEVDVLVETNDLDATYEISGDTALVAGENLLTVIVTAADGETTEEFYVTLNVALNTDATVSEILVDGVDVVDGETLDIAAGTDSVQVDVATSDPDATVEITGDTDLVAGENTLSILVTAADQVTTQEYVITLNVLRNDDVSLATFEVNGEAVEDGGSLELAPLTTSVDVYIETTDPEATFEFSGNEELAVGENDLVVNVLAADGVTEAIYVVTLVVLPNNDASAEVLVNGMSVVDGDALVLDWGTTDVEVEVSTSDPDASFEVIGDSGLVTGENELVVVVTAADGETQVTTTIVLTVLLNSDTSLATFQVAGFDVVDGDSVEVEPGSIDVEVVVETTDPDATFEVFGDVDLLPGVNDLVVTVTAADGETVVDYVVSVVVPLSDDVSLLSFQVDGSDVSDGDVVELAAYTTDVDVVVEANDSDAIVEVEGASGLVAGENVLTVTVTAVDGETVGSYSVLLVVALGDDTSLATFQVNGEDVEDGATVSLAPGASAVEVVVETTDPDATFEVSGDQDLFVGQNELIVTVTAANGDVQDYVVILDVPASDDASVSSITVDGVDVSDGDVIELEAGTSDVAVEVVTSDEDASYLVTGDVGLVTGENILTVTVTAADGETTQDYTITLIVLPSSDTSLELFQVEDIDVADGDVVELPYDSTDVSVIAEPTDPDATVEIIGDTDLLVGENTLEVRVTAADGVTTATYLVTLLVGDGTSTELVSLTVNGSDVEEGDVVELEPGTSDVDVMVETLDPNATYVISGDSGLVDGENTLTVVVTSADGTNTYEYVVTLLVALSNDTSLSVFQVEGNDVADGDTLELEAGTTDVVVAVETTDPDATVEIAGDSELSAGENTLTVTVTAADGETVQVYTVILTLPDNTNTELSKFTINGVDVVDGDVFDVETGDTFVIVEVETADPAATFEIVGGEDLVIGENTLVVTVTAADGSTTQDYTVTLMLSSDDTAVTSILVDGLETQAGDIVTVASDATSVEVEVTTRDENAQVVVKGADELQVGENTVTVTVIAQDGTSKNYVFTVRVGGASSDTALTSLTANGSAVANGDVIQLPSRTTSVNVVAVTRDAAATVKVLGRTGLVVGENTIQVVITAGDLKTTRTISFKAVVAPLSSNTNLSIFTVNGITAVDGGRLEFEPFTRSVTVVAKTEDVEAVSVIAGRSDLKDGNNTLTVTVTAANGSTKTYTVSLFVRPVSTDTSLKTFTIDGQAPTNGVVQVTPGTTSVTVVATPNDARTSVVVTGATGLRLGSNLVTAFVTAESGAMQTYRVTVNVPASNDAAVKNIFINNVDTAAGSIVTLPRGSKAVSIKVVPNDPEAKFVVTGGTGLVNGNNSLNVRVTAADGQTTADYSITLFVTPPSSDKTLKSLKVNGVTTAFDGGSLVVPALTTSVTVEAIANDPESVVVVSGRTGLVEGLNTVSVVVTAADGTSNTYTVSVRVLSLSSDSSLKSLKVNDVDYNGGTVALPFGTKSVSVVAVANDASAQVSVSGNLTLRTGENRVVVRVTAANGTFAETVISVVVAKSSSTVLSSLFVNGLSALGGSVTLPPRTSEAVVKAVAADPEATVVVS